MSMYYLKDIRDGRYVVGGNENVTALLPFSYVEQATRRASEQAGRDDLAPYPYMADNGTATAFARFLSALEQTNQSDLTAIEPIQTAYLEGDMFDHQVTSISAVRCRRQLDFVVRMLEWWRFLARVDAEWLFDARAKLESGEPLSARESRHLDELRQDLSGYI